MKEILKVNITPEEIKKFRKHGLLDETRLIYLKLRTEFEKRTLDNPNKKKSEIIAEITDEFQQKGLSVGVDAVTRIVYCTIPDRKQPGLKVDEL